MSTSASRRLILDFWASRTSCCRRILAARRWKRARRWLNWPSPTSWRFLLASRRSRRSDWPLLPDPWPLTMSPLASRRAAPVEPVMRALSLAIDGMELPAIEKISESQQEDAFQVLIATLLSARTKDATTLAASTRLFKRARTPRTLAKLSVREIETLIYPV